MSAYRVFHLVKGLGRGGAERLLVEGMACRDIANFTYGYGYFLPWKDAFVAALREKGAEVVCFNRKTPASILLSYGQVAKFLTEWKPDLLHCHLPLAGIAGRFAALKCGLPVVYTEHNLLERYHPLTRYANLWTARWQNCVVAVSAEVADSVRAHLKSSVSVRIIHNGIPVETMLPSVEGRKSVRKKIGIPEDAPVIGAVSALRAGKNLSDWIRAAKLISEKNSDAHFLLVGDGPLRQNLRSQVFEIGLESRVHFAGIQEDVIPFYSAIDVFMSSSNFEGLPLALLEAMSMKLPVVATAVGGVPEVVAEGISGFLVAPGDPSLLAEKVQNIIRKPEMCAAFGNAGRSIVVERFSIKRMTIELESLYSEIIEQYRINKG